MFSTGLRTWWSLIFIAPTRCYGMWQSAHATLERAWMPWLYSSTSGCCALSTGAPLTACAVHDFFLGPAASRAEPDSPTALRLRRRAALLARANALVGVVVAAAVRLARGG